MSPRAKPNPFQRCPAWGKGCFVDLHQELRLKARESKTERMLARGPSNFQTEANSTRHALGATRSDIFFQVLVETATLAVTGSLFSVVASWLASHFISDSVGLPFVFERSSAAFALAVAVTLNLTLSLLPARKAGSVSPLEGLRYE